MFPEVWAHFGPIADPVQHRFSVFRVSRIFAAAVGSPPSMKLAPLLEIFEPISSMAFPSAGLGIHRLPLGRGFGEAQDRSDECVVRVIYYKGPWFQQIATHRFNFARHRGSPL